MSTIVNESFNHLSRSTKYLNTMASAITDRKILFYMLVRGRLWEDWHGIDDDNCAIGKYGSRVQLRPVNGMMKKMFSLTTNAVAHSHGAKIFLIGGYTDTQRPHDQSSLSSYFWHINMNTTQFDESIGALLSKKSWVKGRELIFDHDKVCMSSYDGNIFVGGMRGEGHEVYDIRSNTWSEVFHDLKNKTIDQMVVWDTIDYAGRKDPIMLLYVSSNGHLYAYHILEEQKAKVFDPSFSDGCLERPFAILGQNDLLVTYNPQDMSVVCYHLRHKRWFTVGGLGTDEIRQLVYEEEPEYSAGRKVEVHLFRLGQDGSLCLIWGICDNSRICPTVHFRYAKFSICATRGDDGPTLLAQLHPIKSFHIKGAQEIICCLTLEPREEDDEPVASVFDNYPLEDIIDEEDYW